MSNHEIRVIENHGVCDIEDCADCEREYEYELANGIIAPPEHDVGCDKLYPCNCFDLC